MSAITYFEETKEAFIMPAFLGNAHLPERAVLLFMNKEIEDYRLEKNCKQIGEVDIVLEKIPVYVTSEFGEEVAFVRCILGAPGAVMILEQLIAGGAKKILACGCCGALLPGASGEFFLPEKALSQAGTSYQYENSEIISLKQEPIEVMEKVLQSHGLKSERCMTWSTDAFYRETSSLVELRKSEGCSTVEMECAGLAACANFRNISFGQLLFTADSLADAEGHDDRGWGKDSFKASLLLALESAAKM